MSTAAPPERETRPAPTFGSEDGFSRREFLRRSAILAAIGGAGTVATLGTTAPAAAAPGVRAFVTSDPGLHLLRRAAFGVTKGLAAQMATLGPNAWLEQQLAPSSITDTKMDDLMATRFPRISYSIAQALANIEEFSWGLMYDVSISTLARAAWSKRQLFEVMCDFWSNHLNVSCPSDEVWANRHDYDRNVIRKHALGKFSDMLRASATHPAMMLYLNNAESDKSEPNENYGRELLELHTVGVAAGYSEAEMRQSALIMTGFTIGWNTYEFRYAQSWHYTGPVQVLGFSHANATAAGGYQVGLDYVNYLAHHPSTATRIATKLCQRFVDDVPPPALVQALAATYLANDTAIVPVLRQLFTSPEFASSIGSKIRRPMESLVATVRTLGIKPDVDGIKGMRSLYWMVSDLGQAPLAWGPPNGYPDTADAWRSAGGVLARWNSNMSLAAHWWPKELVLPSLRKLFPKTLPADYRGYVDTLSQRLIYRTLEPEHRDAVLAFIGKRVGDRLRETDEAMKWRLPYVVALILDTPYHQVR